jgi:hypothetical protein
MKLANVTYIRACVCVYVSVERRLSFYTIDPEREEVLYLLEILWGGVLLPGEELLQVVEQELLFSATVVLLPHHGDVGNVVKRRRPTAKSIFRVTTG